MKSTNLVCLTTESLHIVFVWQIEKLRCPIGTYSWRHI